MSFFVLSARGWADGSDAGRVALVGTIDGTSDVYGKDALMFNALAQTLRVETPHVVETLCFVGEAMSADLPSSECDFHVGKGTSAVVAGRVLFDCAGMMVRRCRLNTSG